MLESGEVVYRTPEKILVVYKKSALQIAKERKNKRILDLIEKGDPSVSGYVTADEDHKETVNWLKEQFKLYFHKVDFRYRAKADKVKNYDLVVTLGGDGTFMWASKFVGEGLPVLGINSAPDSSVGFYTAFKAYPRTEVEELLSGLAEGEEISEKKVSRLKIEVNGEVVQDRVLNDVLFAAKHPAGMTKYTLKVPTDRSDRLPDIEEQRSSGIWISAPGGSTGANLSAGGWILPLDDERLQFMVREPMKNYVWGTEHRMTHGFWKKGQKLEIICKTRKAVLACDGTTITIPVTVGDKIEISHSDEPLTILGK